MSHKKESRELKIRREGRKTTKITRELDVGLNRDLQYYLGKHYPILIYPAEEGGYVAEIEELAGCITQGETLEEVLDRINNARQLWIEQSYEDGLEIPLPRTEEEYSGKFMVRIPKYLHRRSAEKARRENVSLNQYVESVLSAGVATQNVIDGIKTRLDEISTQIGVYRVPVVTYPMSQNYIRWMTEEAEQEPPIQKFREIKHEERVAA